MVNRRYAITTEKELSYIGLRIRVLLKVNKMTVQDFADEMGVSEQAAYKWFNGSNIPDITKLIDISKLFEVSMDYILRFGPTDVKSYYEATEKEER